MLQDLGNPFALLGWWEVPRDACSLLCFQRCDCDNMEIQALSQGLALGVKDVSAFDRQCRIHD